MSTLHDTAKTAHSLAGQVADHIDGLQILGGTGASEATRRMAEDALEKAEAAVRGLLAVREGLAGLLAEAGGEQADGQGSLEVPG